MDSPSSWHSTRPSENHRDDFREASAAASASGWDLRLERVSKTYGAANVVDGVSLHIAAGEFFSLLGPSGSGKTTTLNMVGGFELPSQGSILLGGVDITHQAAHRRDINTVFQSYALFPHLDVFENVAFGLRRKGQSGKELSRRVHEMLDLVALRGHEKRRPSQLSGGQQQRVALARALVNRPKLLLLDEPLGALDLKLRKQMQIELKRIQSEVGITFLFVTHDQEEAMVMSDRLAVMSGGRVAQVGAPQAVYDHPENTFVATFLGASNLLDGELDGQDGERLAVRLPRGGRVHAAAREATVRGPRVQVGVRPEKIVLFAPGTALPDGWNALEGRIELVAYIGVSHQYSVAVDGGPAFTVVAQNLGAGLSPQRGDAVRLGWQPRHTFVVEPSSVLAPEQDNETHTP
ncbi:putrescine transporter subunit: ATP-binding component of ABC superfamily [Thiomonas sp. X19]|uniref:ABC transporter ATP-binding protein n=1 Tax=Thiomonas sp. X19 TaxID=1050370 RepID=UPI000B6458A8|nr:ABC transporter ATP-binding protein [Thiomonas sp. X19]SCC91638.1 putrescine transporter subunit: ATP-binding component of ABC superfamily [Thiomonas sp. X19]